MNDPEITTADLISWCQDGADYFLANMNALGRLNATQAEVARLGHLLSTANQALRDEIKAHRSDTVIQILGRERERADLADRQVVALVEELDAANTSISELEDGIESYKSEVADLLEEIAKLRRKYKKSKALVRAAQTGEAEMTTLMKYWKGFHNLGLTPKDPGKATLKHVYRSELGSPGRCAVLLGPQEWCLQPADHPNHVPRL